MHLGATTNFDERGQANPNPNPNPNPNASRQTIDHLNSFIAFNKLPGEPLPDSNRHTRRCMYMPMPVRIHNAHNVNNAHAQCTQCAQCAHTHACMHAHAHSHSQASSRSSFGSTTLPRGSSRPLSRALTSPKVGKLRTVSSNVVRLPTF